MAYYNKIGLLVLSPDGKKFLVCQKSPDDVTAQYIMPGGQVEPGEEPVETLTREIREELSTDVDPTALKFIAEYQDVAAGQPGRGVSIKLFSGTLNGEPTPTSEIKKLHWISKDDASNERVSPIIRNKIIPDLMQRGILK